MAYALSLLGRPNVVLGQTESFWLYVDFKIGQPNGIVTVQNGYFAVHISASSNAPRPARLPGQGQHDYSIADEAGNTFHVGAAELFHSRIAEYANEVEYLFLFKLNPNNIVGWFTGGAWGPQFTVPQRNNDQSPFLNHGVSYGDTVNRYAYWASAVLDTNGTRAITLAVPFIARPLVASLLASHGIRGNDLIVSSPAGDWNYAIGNQAGLPGAPQGYVSVSQGAFRALAPGADLEHWYLPQPGKIVDVHRLGARLARLAGSAVPYRTLFTAGVTDRNGATPPAGDVPIEVLYLENLNSQIPVPSPL